jgi:hypothetical protein
MVGRFDKSMKNMGSRCRKVVHKYIHNKLPCNYYQNKKYSCINPTCKACRLEIETQKHIFECTACPNRVCLWKKYMVELGSILEKHSINGATITVMIQNVSSIINNKNQVVAYHNITVQNDIK